MFFYINIISSFRSRLLVVAYYLSSIHFLIFQIPGLVNVDFADVKAVMKDSGTAMLGVGVSSSKNRAEEAAEQATLAPLIGSSIQSATGVVYNITGGKDITLQEVNRVSQVINLLYGLFDILYCLLVRLTRYHATIFSHCLEFEYKLMFCLGI